MYTYEERLRAVKTYIALDFRLNRTIAELGYPSHQALRDWYKEYSEKGDLHRDFIRESQYTQQQKEEAIEHYYANGRNLSKTSKALGYAKRDTIRKWVAETLPAEKINCVIGHAVVKCTEEQKRQAVVEFCARDGCSEKIANSYGVSHSTLYVWKRKLFENGCAETVAEDHKGSREELLKQNAELQEAVQRLEQQLKELEKAVHHKQLEYDVLEKAGEILKKEGGINLELLSNQEKAAVIGALREKYRLKELLICLKMSKSSYCYQARAMCRPDKYSDLRVQINEIFSDVNGCYGYRRIHAHIKRSETTVSEKVVRRLMKEEDLRVIGIKRKKYNSYMGEISPAVENIIDRNFHAEKPNQKWLTDITEFHIPAGKVYLSPLIDCFDGMAVAWSIGTSPDAELVNSMLDEAASLLGSEEKPIIHSDRGGHYRWPGWLERMERYGLTRSMSKKGCSPDNSACEGFFGHLKNEMFYGRSWDEVSIPQFIRLLDNYLHWHNEDRIKISLNGLSPLEFRRCLHYI